MSWCAVSSVRKREVPYASCEFIYKENNSSLVVNVDRYMLKGLELESILAQVMESFSPLVFCDKGFKQIKHVMLE